MKTLVGVFGVTLISAGLWFVSSGQRLSVFIGVVLFTLGLEVWHEARS